MRYFGKQELISLGMLLCWCVMMALMTFIFVTTELSYADTKTEVVQVEKTVEVDPEVIEEVTVEELPYTDSEIKLIAWVTVAEAEGESEFGKRLVIDTVLNRVESDGFPDTVEEVIYQPNQFTSMWNGRADRCTVTDDVIKLVKEEIASKVCPDVLYFRTGYFHDFGTPLFAEGNHYFSTN